VVLGRSLRERLGRASFAAVVAVTFVVILAPLVLVVWLSFFSNEILALPPTGYSLRWYQSIGAQPQFIAGFRLSAVVAVMSAAAALILTVPAAFALTRSNLPGREVMLHALMSPLIVPAIVVGAALYMGLVELEVQTGLPVTGTALGFAAGHLLLGIPWSLRLIVANLASVDRSVEEAALSLGATPLTTALKVTLPLIWPGVVAAALFSFVVSFGNIEVSLFLVQPGSTTLPIAILQYLEWKIDPTVAAASSLQILLIAAALLVTDRFVNLAKVV
jgi:putative spermidine/putrescine transport system permease protein